MAVRHSGDHGQLNALCSFLLSAHGVPHGRCARRDEGHRVRPDAARSELAVLARWQQENPRYPAAAFEHLLGPLWAPKRRVGDRLQSAEADLQFTLLIFDDEPPLHVCRCSH